MAMTFYPLARLHQLYDGYIQCFSINGHNLMLIQSGMDLHIIANHCPHMGASLQHAEIAGDVIRCPSHRFEYQLSTGLPARAAFSSGGRLQRYQVVYEGNQVGVCL